MADNTTLNVGTGGDVIATDDIAGVKYQIVKVAFGALDTATLVSSANGIPVAHPAITKGTQGTTGVTTQDLKDAGRTAVIFSANASATGTTGVEAAITWAIASGTSANTTGVTYNIPAGKTLRITSVSFSQVGNATATLATTKFNLRLNTAAAVTTTSTPVLLTARLGTPATANAYAQYQVAIPDGFEIAGGATVNIGLTVNSVFATNAPTVDALIIGFLY